VAARLPYVYQVLHLHGKLVWSVALDTCVNVRRHSGELDFIPFRFPGQYHDVETGLYYNRFRYYAPNSGIYISQDPIRLLGGKNLYGYVGNSNSEVDFRGLNARNSYPGRVTIEPNLPATRRPLQKEIDIADALAEHKGADVLVRGANTPDGDAIIKLVDETALRAEFKTFEDPGVPISELSDRRIKGII
jgi:RHS repeat-associated protein